MIREGPLRKGHLHRYFMMGPGILGKAFPVGMKAQRKGTVCYGRRKVRKVGSGGGIAGAEGVRVNVVGEHYGERGNDPRGPSW